MTRLSRWICVVVAVLSVHAVQAQDFSRVGRPRVENTAAETLVAHGFEDVTSFAEDGRLLVAYENRVYRYEIRGVQEVIRLLMPELEAGQMLTLVPRNSGIPLVRITVPAEAYHALQRGELSVAQFVDAIEVASPSVQDQRRIAGPRLNPSAFKFDVTIQPQLRTEFGNFSDPVESQINLAPGISTSLWPGMRLSAQVIIPLQNELDESESQVRPGLLTLNQTLRPLPGTLVAATVGYFTNNQYGLDAAVQHELFDGRLMLGADVGYTGYAAYDEGEWFYGDVDVLTYAARVRYHVLPQHSFWLQASYGQFLFQDRGAQIEMERAFGEIRVGFYGTVTDGGENAGVRLSLPLAMRKYPTRGRVRVRSADRFYWQYNYRKLDRSGTAYDTGSSLDNFRKGLTPAFVKAQLAELKGWR